MRILVFGDSIARGSWDTEYGGWVNRFSAWCMKTSQERGDSTHVFNLGINGETAAQLAERIKTELPARINPEHKTLVLISSGINDSKFWLADSKNETDLNNFIAAYKSILQTCKSHDSSVVCVGLTRVNETVTDPIAPRNRLSYRNVDIIKYEEQIIGLTEENQYLYIDVADVVTPKYLDEDGIHPNDEGHRLIFERVKEVLEEEGIL